MGQAYVCNSELHQNKSELSLVVFFSTDSSKTVGLLAILLCPCVGSFVCGVCFIIICFHSLFRFIPREGCAIFISVFPCKMVENLPSVYS